MPSPDDIVVENSWVLDVRVLGTMIWAVNATPRTLEDMNVDGPPARLDSGDDGSTG